MPYVLESVVAQSRQGYAPYEAVDAADMTLFQLIAEYSNAYLTLSHEVLPDLVTLDLADVRDDLDNQSLTVSEWLIANGENTLPTVVGVPIIEQASVNYADAEQADYTIRMVHPTAHVDSYYPRDDMHDLLLEKDEIDYTYMAQHCMVAVNGFFHLIEGGPDGLRVKGGGKAVNHSNKNQVSLLSFSDVGDVVYEPITPAMINTLDDDTRLSNQALITTSQDIDTNGRFPILVIGGYIHCLDGTYTKANNNALVLYTSKLCLIDRYFESRTFFDVPLPSLAPTGIEGTVHREDFHSDPVVKEYLSQSNSFIVWVSGEAVLKDIYDLEKTGLPGCYYSPVVPVHLGLFGSGREMGYWRYDDSGVWVLKTDNALKPHYRFDTVPESELVMYNEQRETTKPFSYHSGRLVTVAVQTLTLPT